MGDVIKEFKPIYILTIYMRPGDRTGMGWIARMIARPKYLELMLRAKETGIRMMIARHSLASFSKDKHIQTYGAEVDNPNKLLCLEIMGAHDELKSFCEREAELLRDATVIIREAEEWENSAFQNAASSKTDLVRETRDLNSSREAEV